MATDGERKDDPRAYAWAMGAILLWATLAAAVGDALDDLRWSTLVLYALGFASATLVALDVVAWLRRRRAGDAGPRPPLVPPGRLLALGAWGVLGYHALFFAALDHAPMVEANLLNYLWPLLMVLLAPLIARERLTAAVVVGALIGFAGAAVVVLQPGGPAELGGAPDATRDATPLGAHALGYAMAALAALAWATFSLGLRRSGAASEGRMTAFVVVSFLLALPLTALCDGAGALAPPRGRGLAAAAFLGVGPMALAFHCWGRAMARGSAARIGALAYLDPLLSTLALAWWRGVPLTGASWAGMALIIGGAAAPALLRGGRWFAPPPGPRRNAR